MKRIFYCCSSSSSCDDWSNESNTVQLFTSDAAQTPTTIHIPKARDTYYPMTHPWWAPQGLTESYLTEQSWQTRIWQKKTWQKKSRQNQTWENKIWQNQTWQNKIWQNQTWQNNFFLQNLQFPIFANTNFPYFASKNEFQIFTTISKVCQKIFKLKYIAKLENFASKYYYKFLPKFSKNARNEMTLSQHLKKALKKSTPFCHVQFLSTTDSVNLLFCQVFSCQIGVRQLCSVK